MGFTKFNLNKQILTNIQNIGYVKPTVIQEKIIPLVRKKKDIVAFAQTGTGKTAAFSLPIIQELILKKQNGEKKLFLKNFSGPRVLVLLPTRELALQVWENICLYSKNLNLRSVVCYGGTKIKEQIHEISKGCDILVATPGRLIDLLNQNYLSLKNVNFFVLDEADHILDIGFIPDVKKIISYLPEHQTLLFSATMTNSIKNILPCFVKDPIFIYANPVNSTINTVNQSVFIVEKKYKLASLVYIVRKNQNKTMLIFVEKKLIADNLNFLLLNEFGIKSGVIHGDKKQSNRQYILRKFKENKLKILISTDIAARGLDINNLGLVINFNLPKNSELYVHRIGRTGRAGKDGISISLCSDDEYSLLQNIESFIKMKIKRIKYAQLRELISINNESKILNNNLFNNKYNNFHLKKNNHNNHSFNGVKKIKTKSFNKKLSNKPRKRDKIIGFALHNYIKPKTKSETPHIVKNKKVDNW